MTVYPGLSQFLSTRKQWRTMLGIPIQETFDCLPFPKGSTLETPPRSPFETNGGPCDPRIAFLLDNGGTANRNSLPLHLAEVRINGEGIAQGGLQCVLPMVGWLQNVLSPVESNNEFSSPKAFLADVQKAIGRNQVTFAHSCFLEGSLGALDEFIGFDGFQWLARRPADYSISKPTFNREDLARLRRIARFKTATFLGLIPSWYRETSAPFPNLRGVFTSDHGQNFGEHACTPMAPSHGFAATPECAWIPIVPLGETEVEPPNPPSPFTWQDISLSLQTFIKEGGVFRLRKFPNLAARAFPLVFLAGSGSQTGGPNFMSVQALCDQIRYSRSHGLYFDDSKPLADYPKSYVAFVPDQGLYTVNPEEPSRDKIQLWKDYVLCHEYTVPSAALAETCGKNWAYAFPGIPAAGTGARCRR